MDLKGPLLNTRIKILPSDKLIKFLETINVTKDLPKNIIKCIKGEPCEIADNDQKIAIDLSINKADHQLINEIKLKISDKKKDITSKNIQNETKVPKEEERKRDDAIFLSTSDIDWLYKYLNEKRLKDNNLPYLHELLEGSEIIMPENEVIKRNPELEARCVKLRAQQEAREYRKMTKGVDNVRIRYPEDNISYQLKQMNRQLIAIGQFILSIFAGFLFGFRGIEWMVGNLDFGFRLLLGVMCALVIALAEIYFLAKKLNEELNLVETTQLGGPPKLKNIIEDPYAKYFDKEDEEEKPKKKAAKIDNLKEHQD